MTKDRLFEIEKYLKDEDEVGASPVLMGGDHRSKAIWAMSVDFKGPTQAAVKWFVGKISLDLSLLPQNLHDPNVRNKPWAA